MANRATSPPTASAACWATTVGPRPSRSEEHTSELQSPCDLPSFPTRRSSDLFWSQSYRRLHERDMGLHRRRRWSCRTVGGAGARAGPQADAAGRRWPTEQPPRPRHRRLAGPRRSAPGRADRKSTRLNSSHLVISPLSLHDALPISFGVSRTVGSMNETWDCIVVGGGAAGLSAALVLGRARRRTLLVDDGQQSNLPAHGIGGLLGHDGRPPAEQIGRAHV